MTSTPRRHVLVDLDGTISDSSPGIGASLAHAFERCGYDAPDDAAIRSMIGPPFELSFPEHGIAVADIERVIAVYRVRYEATGLFENEMYAGIVEMLDNLRAEGCILTLATAKPEPTAKRITEHFGLTSRFAVQVGSTHGIGSGRRTKAEVITHALHLLGVDPHDRHALDHVVMVGDRNHDVEGAHMNAIDCVGVTWGFGSREELTTAGAALIVDTPHDVVDGVLSTYRSVPS